MRSSSWPCAAKTSRTPRPRRARAADRKRPKKASNAEWESRTDPDARIMQHADGHTHLSYRVDTTVDLETGVIVATGAQPGDVGDATDFLERVDQAQASLAERGLELRTLVADKGHHSGENLAGLEQRGLVGLIANPNRERAQPGFRRENFRYDPERDAYECPAGQRLHRLQDQPDGTRRYQAPAKECRRCPNFGVCTTSERGRRLSIPLHQAQIQANQERVHDPQYRPVIQIRRQRGEAPFGYFKGYGGLRRFAGRGREYAQKKTLIAAVGWNLLRLLAKMAPPRAEHPASAAPHAAGRPSRDTYRGLWEPWLGFPSTFCHWMGVFLARSIWGPSRGRNPHLSGVC